jgi:hypothetical protein
MIEDLRQQQRAVARPLSYWYLMNFLSRISQSKTQKSHPLKRFRRRQRLDRLACLVSAIHLHISSKNKSRMATAPVGVAAAPWSLYDLFLDLPHPAGSKACPGPFLIPSPVTNSGISEQEIQAILPQIARFAFPEYDEAAAPPTSKDPAALNPFDVYAMQNESFLQFTFTLQLQSGQRLYGHVRRYLPPHLGARTRYDVGRRGERALVILTRATGADLLYAAILK